MKLNQIRDNDGARFTRLRVARGVGSGRGKTAGRGGKGQTARSGVAINGFEGGQMPIYRRLPKRGFNNISRLKYAEINLDRLQAAIDGGLLDATKEINAMSFLESGMIRRAKDGVRILGKGELKTKVTLRVAGVTSSVKEAVAKLGGEVIIDTIRPGSEKVETSEQKPAKRAAQKVAKKTKTK